MTVAEFQPSDYVIPRLMAAGMSDVAKAVEKCLKAYKAVEAECRREGMSVKETRQKAVTAYRVTIPPMDTTDHVHQAIACITNGMHLDVITGAEASKLLYAAQVSLSLLRLEREK